MMSTRIKSINDPSELDTQETHGQTEEPFRKRRLLSESTLSARTQPSYIIYDACVCTIFFVIRLKGNVGQ